MQKRDGQGAPNDLLDVLIDSELHSVSSLVIQIDFVII